MVQWSEREGERERGSGAIEHLSKKDDSTNDEGGRQAALPEEKERKKVGFQMKDNF